MKRIIVAMISTIIPIFNVYGSTSDKKVDSESGDLDRGITDSRLLADVMGSKIVMNEDFSLENKSWT